MQHLIEVFLCKPDYNGRELIFYKNILSFYNTVFLFDELWPHLSKIESVK